MVATLGKDPSGGIDDFGEPSVSATVLLTLSRLGRGAGAPNRALTTPPGACI